MVGDERLPINSYVSTFRVGVKKLDEMEEDIRHPTHTDPWVLKKDELGGDFPANNKPAIP